jgi:hypothetical protein
LDALADRLDRSTFRVDEAPQGFGGGHRGGGGFIGGWTGGRGPVHCYNCDEQGNLTRDFHFQEDLGVHIAEITLMPPRIVPNLITKWEDHTRKRGII